MLTLIRRIKGSLLKRLYAGSYSPGHYYSPIPDIKYVHTHEANIFDGAEPKDIDLNEDAQFDFLKKSATAYNAFQFPSQPSDGFRYYTGNGFFNDTDGLSLFLILNYFNPKKIIEVGSGFSSACMLDTYEKVLKTNPQLTFIEPDPKRLKSLLASEQAGQYSLKEMPVQQVPASFFTQLDRDDLLFIDGSHISKVGSDLNYLLFSVLPELKSGVIIHFHDICYPFEYPKDWIYDGIYWNEAYLLKAFLMNNHAYEILLFNHFLAEKHRDWLIQHMPSFNSGGSLYIRKK